LLSALCLHWLGSAVVLWTRLNGADDHEVSDNYAGAIPQTNELSREQFLQRRAAAYQAYYEFMPLRRSAMPAGPDMRLSLSPWEIWLEAPRFGFPAPAQSRRRQLQPI